MVHLLCACFDNDEYGTPHLFIVDEESVTIGANPVLCKLWLNSPYGEAVHCQIIRTQRAFIVENFAIGYPVKLNGEDVTGRRLLQQNDVLDLGGKEYIVFIEYNETPAEVEITSFDVEEPITNE